VPSAALRGLPPLPPRLPSVPESILESENAAQPLSLSAIGLRTSWRKW
jgi:hypothetical protein